ncbi:MAG: ComF family protein [Gemmatimonadota bacterium]
MCRAAVRYGGVAESIVRHLKYRGWLHLAEICARHMAGSIGPDALDWLVPVPLHAVRHRARGYNQARAIAEALAAASGLPVIDALERCRATRSQVGLGRSARAANVAEAFGCRFRPAGTVGLVDDVTTSGATMVEAAGPMLSGGAERVVGLAFALAPEDAQG